MESFLIGCALGLFAGMVPGPFLALVATTALERGLGDGLRTALVPLVTEIPVLLASVLVLTRLPRGLLRWIGVLGGVLLLFMAWKVSRDARDATPEKGEVKPFRGHFFRVALVGVMAPAPWIFWFLFAGPLLLNRWHVSPAHGIAFAGAFFACFVGMMMLIAWAVASGRERLSHTWYRRALRGAGILLLVVGSVLIWQSWVGNFEEMVKPQQQIQRAVEDANGRW